MLGSLGDRLGSRDRLTVVGSFVGGWGGVAVVVGDGAVKASVVEPVDVGRGGELDVSSPARGPPGGLPLVEAVNDSSSALS